MGLLVRESVRPSQRSRAPRHCCRNKERECCCKNKKTFIALALCLKAVPTRSLEWRRSFADLEKQRWFKLYIRITGGRVFLRSLRSKKFCCITYRVVTWAKPRNSIVEYQRNMVIWWGSVKYGNTSDNGDSRWLTKANPNPKSFRELRNSFHSWLFYGIDR